MTVTVPDEYNGSPVTSLGGYYGRGVPSLFHITLTEKYTNMKSGKCTMEFHEDTEIPKDKEYETLKFNVKIGKNISEINK